MKNAEGLKGKYLINNVVESELSERESSRFFVLNLNEAPMFSPEGKILEIEHISYTLKRDITK